MIDDDVSDVQESVMEPRPKTPDQQDQANNVPFGSYNETSGTVSGSLFQARIINGGIHFYARRGETNDDSNAIMGERRSIHRGKGDDTNRRSLIQAAATAILTPGAVAEVLAEAAAEAAEFSRQAEAGLLGSGTLDHLELAVSEFDAAYSTKPPDLLFVNILSYRRKIGSLIKARHTLRQGRRLYAYAGWLSELLAWLANDLGDANAGMAFATDAYVHAIEAEYSELAAWGMNAGASIALYRHQPHQSLKFARRGLTHASATHPLTVRMLAQAARAQAAAGDADGYEASIIAAQRTFDRLPSQACYRFGIDVTPLAEYVLTSYPATANILLQQPEQARRHAETALNLYAASPPELRYPSREAITRLDLAVAHAQLGSAEDAVVLGIQVLNDSQVVDSVRSRAQDLARYLNNRWPNSTPTVQFDEALRESTKRRTEDIS